MGKKVIKCMALALSASVLAQGQSVLVMASPMEVATSSSASRQTINTVKTGAVKSGAVKSGSSADLRFHHGSPGVDWEDRCGSLRGQAV